MNHMPYQEGIDRNLRHIIIIYSVGGRLPRRCDTAHKLAEKTPFFVLLCGISSEQKKRASEGSEAGAADAELIMNVISSDLCFEIKKNYSFSPIIILLSNHTGG